MNKLLGAALDERRRVQGASLARNKWCIVGASQVELDILQVLALAQVVVVCRGEQAQLVAPDDPLCTQVATSRDMLYCAGLATIASFSLHATRGAPRNPSLTLNKHISDVDILPGSLHSRADPKNDSLQS